MTKNKHTKETQENNPKKYTPERMTEVLQVISRREWLTRGKGCEGRALMDGWNGKVVTGHPSPAGGKCSGTRVSERRTACVAGGEEG